MCMFFESSEDGKTKTNTSVSRVAILTKDYGEHLDMARTTSVCLCVNIFLIYVLYHLLLWISIIYDVLDTKYKGYQNIL